MVDLLRAWQEGRGGASGMLLLLRKAVRTATFSCDCRAPAIPEGMLPSSWDWMHA